MLYALLKTSFFYCIVKTKRGKEGKAMDKTLHKQGAIREKERISTQEIDYCLLNKKRITPYIYI